MNAENPTPPSGLQDQTPPQNPPDFTEHGTSILNDNEDGLEIVEATPEEKVERELFDKCRGLVGVLVTKSSVGDQPDGIWNHSSGRAIQTDIENLSLIDYTDREVQYQSDNGSKQPDRPDLISRGFILKNNPKFDRLDVGLRNYFSPSQNIRRGDVTSVDIELSKKTEEPVINITQFHQKLSGELEIRDASRQDEDGSRIVSFTDHTERMKRIHELYEILANLYANLPRSSTIPNPSTPPDNLVQ